MLDTTIDSMPATIKQPFDANGFFIANQVVDPSLVQRGIAHMDAVIAGDYETGIPPLDLTKLATAEQLEHLRSNPNSTQDLQD